jgi:glycosyltransferase involved in cell wall biosynthesis
VSPGRALILVENLSVPFDRRVWQESLALREVGYEVAVICPQGSKQDREPYAQIEGVEIHRYPLNAATNGWAGFLREYGTAVWRSWRLARRLGRFDIVHICNPPDLLFLVALPLKLRGARVIFDQHDLVPELYLSRFNRAKDLLYHGVVALERLTYRLADVVIATNGSYRRAALERGRKSPDRVFVVRSAPDLSRFTGGLPDPALKKGREHLLCYLGVMGPQDGVDYALRALSALRDMRTDDWHAAFVGSGDCFDEMRTLSRQLGLEDRVTFTGRIPDEELLTYLATSTVALAPDPNNPLNDVSTMNKILEYMAVGRPIVSFDLREARVSAGDAARYAPCNDTRAFAANVSELLDDPAERGWRGRVGQVRIGGLLSWDHSKPQLLASYAAAMGRAPEPFSQDEPPVELPAQQDLVA